jgi:predicted nucleic acid-binding protein
VRVIQRLPRSCYNLPREAIADALRRLIGLPQVATENPARILRALAWYERGLDAADALHLAAAESDCQSLLSFDGDFVKRAMGLSACKVLMPK